jgi:hypothetical protein
MCNITLIGTRHEENGMCNIKELYKIIERINPEIIFEEMPPSFFDAYYKDYTRKSLESDTIQKYLENHKIEHIPVDYYDIPATFFNDNGTVHREIEKRRRDYRGLMDINIALTKQHGFVYLNSIYCDNISKDVDTVIELALGKMNDRKLLEINALWNNVNNKREHEMIKNIYSYSNTHKYNKGLFLIGAAHRCSLIKKIQEYVKTEILNIDWNYSNYEGIFQNVMRGDYSVYKYYKGEFINPFSIILERTEIENKAKYPTQSMITEYNLSGDELRKITRAVMFWERENMFEREFNKGDFTLEYWCASDSDINEWKTALNPPDKKVMFEIWNRNSLTQIADKQEMDFEEMYKLYCDNEGVFK